MGRSPHKLKPTRRAPPPPPPPPEWEPLYVGDWIEACGFDQKDVVKETGISQSYLSNMSGGRKNNPSAAILRKIAKFLGVTVDDFYQPAPSPQHLKTLRGLSEAAKLALVRSRKDDGE